MKTTILDDLQLPQSVRDALTREALREGKPVNLLIRDKILAVADKVIASSKQPLTQAA